MVAILEGLVIFITRKFNISRKKAYISLSGTLIIAAIPSILSPLEGGFLYNLDIFIGAIGSVIGSIIALFAFSWIMGKKEAIATVNLHSRLKLGNKWFFMTKYVTPFTLILVIFYALSDYIVGYFALNTIPDANYILYPIIVTFIPLIVLSLLIIICLTYYFDKKSSHKI